MPRPRTINKIVIYSLLISTIVIHTLRIILEMSDSTWQLCCNAAYWTVYPWLLAHDIMRRVLWKLLAFSEYLAARFATAAPLLHRDDPAYFVSSFSYATRTTRPPEEMRNALDDLARVMLLWFTLKGAYDLSVLACDAARRQVRAARRARRIAKKLRAKNAKAAVRSASDETPAQPCVPLSPSALDDVDVNARIPIIAEHAEDSSASGCAC